MTKREEKAGDNYFGKKQKKKLNWENLLTKCKKCGSTNLEKLNLYQGMFRKGQGKNYKMVRCKDCKHEEFLEI